MCRLGCSRLVKVVARFLDGLAPRWGYLLVGWFVGGFVEAIACTPVRVGLVVCWKVCQFVNQFRCACVCLFVALLVCLLGGLLIGVCVCVCACSFHDLLTSFFV